MGLLRLRTTVSVLKYLRLHFLAVAAMAEWLRRWTWNPMGSPRAGSNPARCGNARLPGGCLFCILYKIPADTDFTLSLIAEKFSVLQKSQYMSRLLLCDKSSFILISKLIVLEFGSSTWRTSLQNKNNINICRNFQPITAWTSYHLIKADVRANATSPSISESPSRVPPPHPKSGVIFEIIKPLKSSTSKSQ